MGNTKRRQAVLAELRSFTAKHGGEFHSPRLRFGATVRKIPEGRYLWHNQVNRFVGQMHGWNGFRYWFAELPVNKKSFVRCNCGVTPLLHYRHRGTPDKCRPFEELTPRTMTVEVEHKPEPRRTMTVEIERHR